MRGAASRWCCHLLGTSSHDPYVAYVSGRYAAEARGGFREARRDLSNTCMTGSGKGLRMRFVRYDQLRSLFLSP